MSYRLINSNELAIKYPEVNEMPCIYVDLPNGLDDKYYDLNNLVERSKYDNLKSLSKGWLEEKKELEKANNELRSTIDKAIKEMEDVIISLSCSYTIDGLERAFRILKRNIGE